MNDKLKYYPVRQGGSDAEFEATVGIIKAPNGSVFDVRYDSARGGIVIMKVEDDSAVTVQPMTSNQILIK